MLISLSASISLENTTLTPGNGSDGGKGGAGQFGGTGGTGGAPGKGITGPIRPACFGAQGGAGGIGGSGGGGQGGHSFAIAVVGGAKPSGGTPNLMMQKNGLGGLGGAGTTAMNAGKGADGLTGALLGLRKGRCLYVARRDRSGSLRYKGTPP